MGSSSSSKVSAISVGLSTALGFSAVVIVGGFVFLYYRRRLRRAADSAPVYGGITEPASTREEKKAIFTQALGSTACISSV